MIVFVLNPINIPKAIRLMADVPELAHYFEEYGPFSWKLKPQFRAEAKQAAEEVAKYFTEFNYGITYT